MEIKSSEERIRLYRECIASAWAHGDANTWPIKLNASIHLFVPEFGEELIADLMALLDSGKSLEQVARLFDNPSRTFRIIDSVVYSMRRNRYRLPEQRRIVILMLDATKALKYGSEFNEDGRNTIYNPRQVAEAVSGKLTRTVKTAYESQAIHRFCAMMWAYTEAIFFRAHDVTKEIHGPYPYDNGRRNFIVKEYLNLNPRELWPGVSLLPHKSIKIYKQYGSHMQLRIDSLNHLYLEGGATVPSLETYGILVDGREQTIEALQECYLTMQQTIAEISRYVSSASWHQLVLKYADIFWFRKRPLRDALRKPWVVPEHVRDNILVGAENPRRCTKLSDEQSARLAMITI